MASRRGSFRPRQGATRRRSAWTEGAGGQTNTQAAATFTNILGGGVITSSGEVTIVRTRGELTIGLSAATAALDGFSGAVGIGIVTTQAFNVGVTALPLPISDAEWDGWMWHQYFNVFAQSASPGFATDGGTFARYQVDSKAMRRLEDEMTLVAVIEGTEVGTSTMNARFDSRILVKLP